MSSYFRQIKKTPDERALIKEIVNRIQRLEQEVKPVNTLEFSQTIRANNDTIVIVDTAKTEVNAVVIDPNLKDFQLPEEPNGKTLTLWLNMNAVLGSSMADVSGFSNHGAVTGTIQKQDGQVTDLPGRLFELSEGGDKIRVSNAASINTFSTPLPIGFSINFSIKPVETSLDGGMPRVICCKTDDDLTYRQYGWMIWVDQNNNLYFYVTIAGVGKTASKLSAFPALNSFYRVVCTYDRPTSTPKIYVNGAASTDPIITTNPTPGGLSLPTTTFDLIIGGTDESAESRLSAILCDFRYWRERVLTQVEIENLQANGYSITAIAYPARVGTALTIANDIWGPGGSGGDPGTPPPNPPPTPPPPPSTLVNFESSNFDSSNFA